MTGDEARPDRGDIIEIGGPIREDGTPRRRRPPWLLWLPLVLLAGIGLAVYARTDGGPERPVTTPSATGSPAVPGASTAPTGTAPVVTEVGRPLLGITDGYELYGRGPDSVVRIEFAKGRVTVTPVPTLASSGAVNFLVGPDLVVIRPRDAVPGYVVPDGKPAERAREDFNRSGPMLPGPDPGSVWVTADDVRGAMLLVRFDGKHTGVAVAAPPGTGGFAEPDGAGYPSIATTGGVYSLRPDGVRRMTTGELLAVGPTHWLARECDERLRCGGVLIEQRGGARRPVRLPAGGVGMSGGVVSGDAARAALLVAGPGGSPRVHLLDLRSGADRPVDLPVDASLNPLAWSPDGRWLFAAGLDGQLHTVDPATAEVRDLGVRLPQIGQVVIRPAAR
ncbi:hypothetical protein [Plantactinospora sp. GCM10030261]|uniref:hypothetical protein n=1 Tax=Plantactinospora sp. GCM10030261 TaxID=3273420 RepID=UPI0036186FDE